MIDVVPTYNTQVISYGGQSQVKSYFRPIRYGYMQDKDTLDSRKRKDGEEDTRTAEQLEHAISTSRNRTINTVYSYALANRWEYFLTLTFDPKKIDSTDYGAVSSALGKWLNNTKTRYCGGNLKYLVVPELHKDGKKYHFHGLLSNIGELPLTDSGHVDEGGNTIYNLPTYRLGFTTVTKVRESNKACSYMLKYITKDLCATTKNKRRFWASHNLDRPVIDKFNIQRSSDDELPMLLDSLGEVVGTKAVHIKPAHNTMSVFYVDTCDTKD
jgi:hypothetical protein